eukprot:183427-Chlamydomonas_euryale.AAC.1
MAAPPPGIPALRDPALGYPAPPRETLQCFWPRRSFGRPGKSFASGGPASGHLPPLPGAGHPDNSSPREIPPRDIPPRPGKF